MDSGPANNIPSPDPGLPPVIPPSGRFIAQLFVIPALIILVVVVILIGLSYLATRVREPNYFLAQLDSDNHDVRWRGMNDLAQILKRTEPAALRWKTDPAFGFELADRLDKTFHELLDDEKRIGEDIARSTDKDKQLLWRKLREKRDYAIFLAGALGEMQVPVGAPVLCDMIRHDASPDLNGNTLQRRKAIWALMNMGENMKGFAQLPDERRQEIVTQMNDAAKTEPRGRWARTALYYIDKSALPSGSVKDIVKVDEALALAANADDRFLRELSAMAFNYWDGELAESTLLRLTHDRGQGTMLRVEEGDEVAQEDKGLVFRGFLLFAMIACLVAFVLALLFWRNEPPRAQDHAPPEEFVPLAAMPTLAPFPANVSWIALAELGETCPSAPGFDIRYNAAATLARRGSPATPWPILLEMLDEKQQLRNSRVRQPNGQDTYDEIAARRKMIHALQAITVWHDKHKSDARHEVASDMRDVYARVDDLATSATGEVKNQAEKTRVTLFR